jgi:hypothetical protein
MNASRSQETRKKPSTGFGPRVTLIIFLAVPLASPLLLRPHTASASERQQVSTLVVAPTPPLIFVRVDGDQFVRDGEPFRVRGANYYPKDHAWKRFWLEYANASDQIDAELRHAKRLGLNALRIFLPFELFADETSPHLVNLMDFMERLERAGLLALVTLFDFYPSDSAFPYCDSPPEALMCDYGASKAHISAVATAIGATNPSVLSWDLKNEMDRDYDKAASKAEVQAWAREMISFLRASDPNHLITIGFFGAVSGSYDVEVATELACEVDFTSLHYFLPESSFERDLESLRGSVEGMASCPGPKAILLEEFGLHTLSEPSNPCTPSSTPGDPCDDPHTESEQAAYYNALLALGEADSLAGYLFWTLADFSYILLGSQDSHHCQGVLRSTVGWAEPECDPLALTKLCRCEVEAVEDYEKKPAAETIDRHYQDRFFLDLFSGWVNPNTDQPPPGWTDNFSEDCDVQQGGALFRGFNPNQPDRTLWSHTEGRAAISKFVCNGTTTTGVATSPELRNVDLDRFHFLRGEVSCYSIHDSTNGSDSLLRIGVRESAQFTSLLTVIPGDIPNCGSQALGPETDRPLDFHFDLREELGWTGNRTFQIELQIDPVGSNNGYSASYEFEYVGLAVEGIFSDGFESGDTSAWSGAVPAP